MSDARASLVRVRPDGVIEPVGKAAAQALRGRPGPYRVVVTASDVVVLRHAVNEEESASPVLLAGELREGDEKGPPPLVPILDAIVRAGWVGELAVVDTLVRRSLFFDRGVLVGVQSNAVGERIGAVATKMGLLTAEQVKTVVGKLGSGKRFGEVAIELGLLARERVFEALRRQVDEVVEGALSVRVGSFAFVQGFDEARLPARSRVDAAEVIARVRATASDAGLADDDVVAIYNDAIAAIFAAMAVRGKTGLLRSSLDAYAAESVTDRAIFTVSRVQPDGTIDAAGLEEAIAAPSPADARKVLRKRLHESLVYALFVACAELPREEERKLLARVEPSVAALTKKPSEPPPTTVKGPAPLARVALQRTASRSMIVEEVGPTPRIVPAPKPHLIMQPEEPELIVEEVQAPHDLLADVTTPEPQRAFISELPVVEPLAPSPRTSTPRQPVADAGDVEPVPETHRVVSHRPPPMTDTRHAALDEVVPLPATRREVPPERPTLPGARKRSNGAFVVIAVVLVAGGLVAGVMAGLRDRETAPPPATSGTTVTTTTQTTVAQRQTATTQPTPVVTAAHTASASGSGGGSAKPMSSASTGTLRTADSGGHRVWIDGHLVGNTPQSFEVPCGHHVVRVGSGGQPQMTEVPCGGEVSVELR